jgi:hypothetical protein
MGKITFLAAGLWVICILSSGILYAENSPDNNLSDGMEVQEVEPGYKLLLPKGTVIQKKGDLRVVEGPGEYAARRFEEYDAQIAEINRKIETLQKKVEEIKNVNQR